VLDHLEVRDEIEAPPEAPEWAAVRDRLKRACSG